VKGVTAIEEFVSQLSVPRKIMLLVPAGIVDAVIDNLIPHLEKGDIIIDGGNSHYVDTVRSEICF
jgi:6-phosphogluconate dehydrogenase